MTTGACRIRIWEALATPRPRRGHAATTRGCAAMFLGRRGGATLCRGAPANARAYPRWRAAVIAGKAGGACLGIGAGAAVVQGVDVGMDWSTRLRLRASQCQGPTEGLVLREGVLDCQRADSTEPSATVTVLFLGDSLVSGVGAQDQGEGAPPVPAALASKVAARMAETFGHKVHWASVGITGASVERLRHEGIPLLKEKFKNTSGKVVVVLVVGINDLRSLNLLSYRFDLRRLVDELRSIKSDGRAIDMVLLPEISLADAPIFQTYPMQYFVRPICAFWEYEKWKAIRWFREKQVRILPAPDAPPTCPKALEQLFSADRVHPSETGYMFWADSIAKQIHTSLLHRGNEPLVA